MGAKQKLNSANVVGALVVAAFIGGAFGSWTMFTIAAAVLVVAAFYTGDIRR